MNVRLPAELDRYDFADGGEAGTLFLCFARDPRRQFVPVQRRLAGQDALRRHAVHTVSAVFAVPPAGFAADERLWAAPGRRRRGT